MNDIHQLKPMTAISIFDTPVPLFLVVLLVFLVIVSIIWKQKRRSISRPTVTVAPPHSLGDILLAYQKQLRDSQSLIQTGQVYDFALKASDIIKTCVAHIYQTKIKELTTAEIKDKKELPQPVIDAINNFLVSADQHKFDDDANNHIGANADLYAAAEAVFTTVKNDINHTDSGHDTNNHS